jgi:hypothetical protein
MRDVMGALPCVTKIAPLTVNRCDDSVTIVHPAPKIHPPAGSPADLQAENKESAKKALTYEDKEPMSAHIHLTL